MAAGQKRWLICFCLLLGSCAHQTRRTGNEQTFRAVAQQIDQGEFQGAAEAAKQAWTRQPDSVWSWRFKLQYALCLLYTDHVEQAAQTLSAKPPSAFSSVLPRYLYVTAYLHHRQHDPATPSLVRAAIEAGRTHGDAASQADGLLLLLKCGDYEKLDRKQIAAQALLVARQNHLTFQETAVLSQLGLMALSGERYADAIPYFQQTAVLAKRIQARYLEASALANLGECYFNLGDLDRALRRLLEARSVLRPTDPSALRINVNNELGSLQSLRQQNADALKYFRDAFKIAEPDPRLRSYVPAAENLAQALIEQRSFDEAEKVNSLAIRSLRLYPSQSLALRANLDLNRAGIAAGRGQLQAALVCYSEVLGILQKEPSNSVQWSAYAQLAVVQERLGDMQAARASFEHALAAIESNRSAQNVTDYQITFLSALIRFYQQYVDFLVRQNQPWAALAVADSSRASVLMQGHPDSRQQAGFAARIHQRALDSHSTFLFYWLAPDASYLWAVTPRGDSFQRLAQSKGEIERDVESYSSFIQGQREDTLATSNSVGRRLYRTLIGPVESSLTAGAIIVIVPDGALHSLNFETLLVAKGKPHYWIEDVSLTVAPSLGILLTAGKPQLSAGGALVIGDPVYTGTDYPALPESAQEVQRVSARFPNTSTVLTQRKAVRNAYASSHPDSFSLIHFSAHVDADAGSPLDSSIILSSGNGGSRLYARDVMAIPLHAGLVTISGCRSVGAKALSGEGMVGFAWAAFQAGAQNAVTSLWAVDDRSTADLMDGFYAGVTAGKTYAVALREAKLEMLHHRYRRPYYWAPFQLYSRSVGRSS